MNMGKSLTLSEESLFKKIYVIRDQKVLLDSDLALMYDVETKVLKQAVLRNKNRFPKDFMFVLNNTEFQSLRSQFVTSNRGGTRYAPMVFTEQGIAMLSSVLGSKRAVAINIQIMRVFVKMRQMIMSYKDMLDKIERLEASDVEQIKHIRNIYDLITEKLELAAKNPRRIGFKIPSSNRRT